MAITINSTPSNYSSLHAPLWFVVSSTNTGQTSFKYVCDIYVSGTLISRIKSFPQPTSTKGIFDVSGVIRDYWNSYFKPNISLPNGFVYTGSDIYVDYQIKFGEEYSGTTYVNLQTSTQRAYNYVSDYLMNPTSNINLTPSLYASNYTGVLISNRDKLNAKFSKDNIQGGYLFISSLCDLENTNRVHSLDISVYNGTTTNYTGSNVTFKDFALIDCSPRSINQYLGSSVINSNTIYYDVKFKIAGAQTDLLRVYLTCSQYDLIPLHFLNALGGYDTFIFTQVNRQTRNVEKKSFERLEWEYDSTSESMKRVDSYGRFYGGTIPFASKQTLTYKLISDWVSVTDYLWLKELIASPEVYMERNNQFIPVTIGTNSWNEKKRYADKTFNIELDIELGNKVNAQFR